MNGISEKHGDRIEKGWRNFCKYTCKNTSVVDYCILSPELFSHVENFEILPFDPLLSDVHSVVCVEFISKPLKNDSNHSCSNEPDLTAKSQTKWKKEHKELFIDTLDANAVFDLNILLTVPRRYFFCGSFIFCSVLCLLCFVRVCLYVLCGHLLGKG